MIDLALSVLALLAGGFSLQVYAGGGAAPGYQGEPGFHRNTEAQEPAEARPSESPG